MWCTPRTSGVTTGIMRTKGVDAQAASAAAVRGGLLIALREVRDIVDILPGKAMAPDVVTAGGTLTVINVHGPGSGGDCWASKASFRADVAMYAAAKSAGGTRAVLLGGDFNVWLESPWHPTTRRFQALWEQCGFHRAGREREEDRRPTRAGHRLDSFLLNSPLVPWAERERPHLAPGRSPASLGSDHGPVVLDIPLAVAGKERVTRMAYSHAQGRLHAIRPDSPGVREAAAAVLQRPCGDRRLQAWLSSDQDTATMGTSKVQAVFDLLYAFRDDVSRVTGVRMPSGVDPQYPYGQAETEASLDQVLSDQQALAWRAHQLWQRDAAAARLHSGHVQYGVCRQFMVPSASFATHAGNTWVDRVLRAMGTLRVGLLMPSPVYSCVHAHLPQVQWAGRKWVSQSYTFKGRDICIPSGPRTDATVQSLTDPANDLLHAGLPCHAPGHWAVQLQECHEDHLHLPHAGVGPHQLDHVWLTGLRDVFRPQLPGPLTHRLIHPVRRKKASKRNRQSAAGDVYVVGGYREEEWDPANPGLSMLFVPLAALLFLLGDVFQGYQQQDDPASVPLLTPHTWGGISPPPLWVVHGRPAFCRACAAVHKCSEWAIVLLLPAGPIPDPDEYSVPEVVRMSNVPDDPHVAVTSLRDGGAVEQGSVVVYEPSCSATVWGAEYTTALDAIKSVCGCDLAWRPHAVYRPRVVLSPELAASSAASLGKVVQSPHSDVA